jgi:uncharacterized membrane protein
MSKASNIQRTKLLSSKEIIFLMVLFTIQIVISSFVVSLLSVDFFGGPQPFYDNLIFFSPILGDLLYIWSKTIKNITIQKILKVISMLIAFSLILVILYIATISLLSQ